MNQPFFAVAATVWLAILAIPTAVAAQDRPVCRETRAENMPNSEMLLARAYDCVERGFSSSLLSAADEVEKGYKGDPPDWRRAKEAYEFIANRNEGRKFNTLAFHNWVASLDLLSRNYEQGRPGSGWPQDLQLARSYKQRVVQRFESDSAATPANIAYQREELLKIDGKLALQRQRSGRWTGDIAALSQINRFALRDPDIGAPHLKATGFAAIITFIDPVDGEPEDNPAYNFNMEVYTDRLIANGDKGVCLILSNADIADPGQQKVGIWFEHLGSPPFRQTRMPYQGWYRLRLVGGTSYRPIEWPQGVAARTVGYEFRPASSAALCPERF